MPRAPVIPHDNLKRAIFETDGIIDEKGRISGPSKECWQEVSRLFGGIVSPKYIYLYVYENRHNCFEELKIKKGVVQAHPLPEDFKINEDLLFEDDDTSTLCSIKSTSDEQDEVIKPQKTFQVIIPNDVWSQIKPVKKNYDRKERRSTRTREVLPPFIWEQKLVELLWDQHKIPCAYTFIRSYVYKNDKDFENYVTIQAICKECGASATGKIVNKPCDGEDVPMTWRAKDTREVRHKKKRPLKSKNRTTVGTELQNKSVSVYRRLQAKKIMDQGDKEAPYLFSTAVLRKAKQEKEQAESINVPRKCSDLEAVLIMKHRQPYAGTIHDIGIDKFFLHYYTPAQVIVFKAHCKNNYSSLSLDATGGLVRKISRLNSESGNIFLYEGVVNTGTEQIPVVQMLSEKHDANSILYWLNEYLRNGGSTPNEVVTDNSGALISAIVRSFCECSGVNEYLNKCFSYLLGNEKSLPACYLRLDVAHFISSAGKWSVWQDRSMARVKDFYLRCLALLIMCESIKSFEKILKHILILSLSPNEGVDENGYEVPMEETLRELSDLIKNFKGINYVDVDKDNEEDLEIDSNSALPESDSSHKGNLIQNWVFNVEKQVQQSVITVPSGRLNPYYAPSVSKEFLRLSHRFVMWTAVMVEPFHSPNLTSSTASVESDFSDLKNNILKGLKKPLSIPRFLSLHIDAIEGSCRILGASSGDELKTIPVGQKRLNEKEKLISFTPTEWEEESQVENNIKQEETTSQELNQIENWKGLGVQRKKDKSNYLNPHPELEVAIKANLIQKPKKILLKNGNLCPPVKTNENSMLLRNTCAFDALVQVIAATYTMYENYRDFVNNSTNPTLQTAKSLATLGAKKETYALRALALSESIEAKTTLMVPHGISTRTRKPNTTLDYDCTANAPSLSKRLMREVPSISMEAIQCTEDQCKVPYTKTLSVLDTDMTILLMNGVGKVGEAILSSLKIKSVRDEPLTYKTCQLERCLPPCKGIPTVTFEVGKHILVDIDYLNDRVVPTNNLKQPYNRPQALEEYPVCLELLGQKLALVGVVAYVPGHYIAYTRQVNGTWKVYNDLSNGIFNVKSENVVSGHLLLYVKLNN